MKLEIEINEDNKNDLDLLVREVMTQVVQKLTGEPISFYVSAYEEYGCAYVNYELNISKEGVFASYDEVNNLTDDVEKLKGAHKQQAELQKSLEELKRITAKIKQKDCLLAKLSQTKASVKVLKRAYNVVVMKGTWIITDNFDDEKCWIYKVNEPVHDNTKLSAITFKRIK